MVDTTNNMIYRIGNLDTENERINYQMSSGKILDKGSDDSVLYGRYLDIEDDLRTYEGLKTQVEKTTAQNDVSDSTMNEVKQTYDDIKSDLLKSLNAGMSRTDRAAVGTNIEGMRENLISLSNTTVDDEYIFSGSDTTSQTFTKDPDYKINGKVSYGGNADLRNVAVEPGVYRDRGVTAHDVFMYNVDTTSDNGSVTFTKNEVIRDDEGFTWQLNDAGDKLEKLKINGSTSGEYMDVTDNGEDPKVYTTETISDATDNGHIKDSTSSGLELEARHSTFEDLNVIINALNGYKTIREDGEDDGKQGEEATDEEVRDILSQSLEKMSDQYDSANIGQAELGGRNAIFDSALTSIDSKVTHYNILMQDTNGADMAKLAMESKSLEMTYEALYSTVAKMSQLSIVNYLK
jgi:flagellar hook-associated protein 3 FlgL